MSSQANRQESGKARQGRRRPSKWPFILSGGLLLVACLQGGITLFGQDAEEGAPIAGGNQASASQAIIIEAEKARVERRFMGKTQELFWAGLLGVFAVVTAAMGILTYFHSDTKAEAKESQAELKAELKESQAELKRSQAELNRRLDEQKAELKAELKESQAELKRSQAELKAELNRRLDEQKAETNRRFDKLEELIRQGK